MNRRRPVAAVAAALVVAALITLPTSAVAADEPEIDQTGDTITYVDPALARAGTTTVEGTLRVAYIDRIDEAGTPTSDLDYAVVTEDGESVPVQIAEDLPAAAANGDIEAEVVDAGSADAQLAEATVDTVAAAAAAPAASTHRAYVVLVPRTGRLPSVDVVSTRLKSAVLDEWVTESEGSLSGFTVAGKKSLPISAPTNQTKAQLCAMSNTDGLWDAGAALFPDVRFTTGSGNHLIMILSDDCPDESSSLGIGTVGRGLDDGGASTLLWDTDYVDATGVHELGHNFSLGHANARRCPSCAANEYYDIFSVMGFGTARDRAPALDTAFRDALGITVPGEVEAVTRDPSQAQTAVVRTLQPRGSSSGLRGLKVLDPVSRETFWVENRAGGSADRDAGSPYDDAVLAVTSTVNGQTKQVGAYRFRPGVTITQIGSGRSLVLNPRENGFTDEASIQQGQTWTSRSGGVTVEVGQASVGGPAAVSVTTEVDRPQILTTGIGLKALVGRAAFTRPTGWAEGTTFSYVWRADGQTVARTPTYTAAASRLGQPLVLELTGTKPDGSASTRSSLPTTIGLGRFVATAPRVSGTMAVGRRLSVSRGTWSPSASYSYRWYRSTKPISGATGSTYTLTRSDKGHRIRVRVVGRRTAYAQLITYSAYRGPTQ